MAALMTFEKQPREQKDFDVHFDEYFDDLGDGDYLTSHATDPVTGITLITSVIVGPSTIKFWVSGGTSGQKYRVTFIATTHGGRQLEADVDVKVKEE